NPTGPMSQLPVLTTSWTCARINALSKYRQAASSPLIVATVEATTASHRFIVLGGHLWARWNFSHKGKEGSSERQEPSHATMPDAYRPACLPRVTKTHSAAGSHALLLGY
ncbi:hypothetical protein Vretifemale_15236, partial [Volvox reticuliferus]